MTELLDSFLSRPVDAQLSTGAFLRRSFIASERGLNLNAKSMTRLSENACRPPKIRSLSTESQPKRIHTSDREHPVIRQSR